MHKMFLPMLLVALLVPAHSQAAPEWLKECSAFSDEWYCGSGASNADAMGKIVEQMLVKVKSEAEQTTSIAGRDAQLNYTQKVKASTGNIEIAGAKFYTHPNGAVYAAVKKKDLANFYRSGINSLFAFAEKEFAIIEQLAEQGKKKQALEKIPAVEDSLKNVSYWGALLQAVESDNSYRKREQDFWRKINEAKKSLERGTSVYLDISGISDAEYFAERLGAQMQERQCNCMVAENAGDADYNVKIKVRLGSCVESKQSNSSEIYCYASANVSVNNVKYKKPLDVKIPDAKGGWANRNKEKATDEAFKELTNSLAEKIIQSINK